MVIGFIYVYGQVLTLVYLLFFWVLELEKGEKRKEKKRRGLVFLYNVFLFLLN